MTMIEKRLTIKTTNSKFYNLSQGITLDQTHTIR